MNAAFADTFYFLALLDAREPRHQMAAAYAGDSLLNLVTTEWILTEFADAYCDPRDRADFASLYRALLHHPRITIVPSDPALFRRGVEFFEQRRDKAWSLTDCISFVVMHDQGLREAHTGDHHYEQAGFVALLK